MHVPQESSLTSRDRATGPWFLVVSVGAHAALAAVLGALWHPPQVLAAEPHPPPATQWVIVEEEDAKDEAKEEEAVSNTQELAGASKHDASPEAPAATAPVKTAPAPTAPAKTAPPTKPHDPEVPAAPQVPAPTANPRPDLAAKASADPSATPAATPAPAGSGAGDGRGPGDGSGEQEVVIAPDLVARFTKFLAKYAEGAGEWEKLPTGTLATFEIELTVGEGGKLVRGADPLAGVEGVPPAVAKAVRNTAIAPELNIKLALPPDKPGGDGGVVRPGKVRLKIKVALDDTDGAGKKVTLRFDYDQKARKGPSQLVLESGRRVRFDVEVVRVEAAASAPPPELR